MGRNLYILAGTLGFLALASVGLSFSNVAQSPGDVSLWRTTGIALLCIALTAALGGVLSTLFEQAERRAEVQRKRERESRRQRPPQA